MHNFHKNCKKSISGNDITRDLIPIRGHKNQAILEFHLLPQEPKLCFTRSYGFQL